MDQQTALTTSASDQHRLPARHNLAIEGLEDLTMEEDLILPRWRIVQYSSTIKGHPGQFNNNLSGEVRNHLDLVILNIPPSRARFDAERSLVCISRNGFFSTSGQPCLDCPFSQWGPDGQPPECSRGYTMICLDPRDNSLCLIGALRTSVPAVRRYNSLLAHQQRPPFSYVTRFTAQDEAGPKGKYFVLNLETLRENTPDEISQYRQRYLALANVRIAEAEEPIYEESLDEQFGQEELPF